MVMVRPPCHPPTPGDTPAPLRMTHVPEATGPRSPHDGAGRRLPSLDLLRGLTVLGMILVNATEGVSHYDAPVFGLLLHADWAGFTLADAVFPAFILMVGVSIAISSRGDSPDVARILGRALRLVLLGLLLSNLFWLYDFETYMPRLPGVLQRIGIVYAVTALLYPLTGWRTRAALAGAVLLLYWPLCLIPAPDGLPTDLWAPGHNFVSWFDRRVLGTFAFVGGPAGYDPEGLLSTVPTIAEALIGTLAGDWLRRGRPVVETARTMAAVALALVAAGLLWGLALPIAKDFWTSSYVCLSAGVTLLLLAAFHLRYDRQARPVRRGSLLGSFGRNAIAAYTLHELTAFILTGDAMQRPFLWLRPFLGTQLAALAPVLLFTLMIWRPIAAMDRRGWYLKI
jgi:predicted acyltransferase